MCAPGAARAAPGAQAAASHFSVLVLASRGVGPGGGCAGPRRERRRGAEQNETVTKRLTLKPYGTGHPNARCPALASTATGVSFSSWPHAAILTGAVVAPERLPTASTALITCAVAALTSLGSGGSG